jgi:hypothetical protein
MRSLFDTELYTPTRARGDQVSAGFPVSWDTWRAGVQEAYRVKAEFDKRVAAGDVLFNDERRMHKRVNDIVERYTKTGKKKPGYRPQRRIDRMQPVGATTVSLGLVATGLASQSEADELMNAR